MAGRGTDIRLGPGVIDAGGRYVILTEYHDSRRIDRQLYGRSARQGDPGFCRAVVALDDEIFALHAPASAALARGLAHAHPALAATAHGVVKFLAQRGAERRNAEIRVLNLKQDRQLDRMLAFSGRGE